MSVTSLSWRHCCCLCASGAPVLGVPPISSTGLRSQLRAPAFTSAASPAPVLWHSGRHGPISQPPPGRSPLLYGRPPPWSLGLILGSPCLVWLPLWHCVVALYRFASWTATPSLRKPLPLPHSAAVRHVCALRVGYPWFQGSTLCTPRSSATTSIMVLSLDRSLAPSYPSGGPPL